MASSSTSLRAGLPSPVGPVRTLQGIAGQVGASSAPTCDYLPCNVRTDLTALGRPARRYVDELATKGPARISRFGGPEFSKRKGPVEEVGVVVFQNGIQDRLGRRDRLQYGQPRPAEIRPVCRLVADHRHICDRRPPRLEINRGNAKLPQQGEPLHDGGATSRPVGLSDSSRSMSWNLAQQRQSLPMSSLPAARA